MASLYIKDRETNEVAGKLARARGNTKTDAVALAPRRELDRDTPADRRPFRKRMVDFLGAPSLADGA